MEAGAEVRGRGGYPQRRGQALPLCCLSWGKGVERTLRDTWQGGFLWLCHGGPLWKGSADAPSHSWRVFIVSSLTVVVTKAPGRGVKSPRTL